MAAIADVLVLSKGVFHPSLPARRCLKSALQGLHGFRFRFSDDLRELTALEPRRPGVLLLYFHAGSLPPGAVDRLVRWVSEGGGLVALHAVIASCKRDPAFGALLGGRFDGHSPVRSFEIRPVLEALEAFRGFPAIRLRDEIYRHRFSGDIQVQCATEQDGQVLPMAWTRRHGRGRVFCFAPGHKADTWLHADVIRLLAAALEWAAEEKGLLPAGTDPA